MSDAALLADFVDDEMLRAPMTVDIVADAVHEHWRLMGAGGGRGTADPARVLRQHRGEFVAATLKALRDAVQADLHRRGPTETSPVPRAPTLSLIDESDVLADIELSRCIEAVRLRAETALRELQTYTSALVGDPNVSRDTNPFRPELFVRALWQGVQVLPLPRGHQVAFLAAASQPLARSLQMAYEAAIERLSQQGVAPAAHRTIVMLGAFAQTTSPRHRPPPDLHVVRDSLAMPLVPGAPPSPPPARAAAPAPEVPLPAWPADADPQLGALLSRLFAEIGTEPGLSPELVALLPRLLPAALRIAAADATLLDSYDHPVWRLVDELAFAALVAVPSDRLRVMGLARNLVVHLSAGEATNAASFAWAIDRIAAMAQHLLAQARTAAGPQIERLRHRDAQQAAAVTAPLDIHTLDTVPAELLPEDGAGTGGSPPFAARPGDHLRMHLQGEWRMLQVLDIDVSPPLWLLRECSSERLWALRGPAVERLAAERLARPLRRRSLVRRAADRVLRAM